MSSNTRKNIAKSSINRNILECKVRGAYTNAFTESGINRNILECKDNKAMFRERLGKVLIETYWNVKITSSNSCLGTHSY